MRTPFETKIKDDSFDSWTASICHITHYQKVFCRNNNNTEYCSIFCVVIHVARNIFR